MAKIVPLTLPGLISDAQRNLILLHASSAVFQHCYLLRYITQDTQAIYRGLEPQTAVMRAASGMTRPLDPRRPRHLTDIELAEVKRHPEVKLLLRVRKSLAKRIRAKYGIISRTKGTKIYDMYQQACRQHHSKKKAVRKALMAQVKVNYGKRQPLADIESQLNGTPVKLHETTAFEGESQAHFSKESCRAFAAPFTFATSEPAEERRRRADAISGCMNTPQKHGRELFQFTWHCTDRQGLLAETSTCISAYRPLLDMSCESRQLLKPYTIVAIFHIVASKQVFVATSFDGVLADIDLANSRSCGIFDPARVEALEQQMPSNSFE